MILELSFTCIWCSVKHGVIVLSPPLAARSVPSFPPSYGGLAGKAPKAPAVHDGEALQGTSIRHFLRLDWTCLCLSDSPWWSTNWQLYP